MDRQTNRLEEELKANLKLSTYPSFRLQTSLAALFSRNKPTFASLLRRVLA
jgi:hypothetical protein